MLHDHLNPGGQSQAELLLVQSPAPEAEKVVRQGLRQTEDADVFLRWPAPLAFARTGVSSKNCSPASPGAGSRCGRAAAEALGRPGRRGRHRAPAPGGRGPQTGPRCPPDGPVDSGPCGRKVGLCVLLDHLEDEHEGLRLAAADALADLSGQSDRPDPARWNAWWSSARMGPRSTGWSAGWPTSRAGRGASKATWSGRAPRCSCCISSCTAGCRRASAWDTSRRWWTTRTPRSGCRWSSGARSCWPARTRSGSRGWCRCRA